LFLFYFLFQLVKFRRVKKFCTIAIYRKLESKMKNQRGYTVKDGGKTGNYRRSNPCGIRGLTPTPKREEDYPMQKIEYAPCGDYLLPLITLNEPPPDQTEPLGRYARMRRAYLREHRPILYSQLLLSERLFPLLREVDEAARSRLETIADREIAHEIICAELVYD